MLWFKRKQKIAKSLIERTRWFEEHGWKAPGYGSESQRLEILESEMNLWNKRMRYIKNLLDGQTETNCCGHDSCCEIWKAFKFEGTSYCPKCGEFLGYRK